MLGRLNYDSLPFYSAIAFGGAAVTVLAGVAVVGVLTYFRLWGWLWRNYLTSVDHKKIAVMYIVLALVMLVRGFADAFMMRSQQLASVAGHGYLEGDHFQQVFTAHGTIMILFMAMPFMSGLINFAMPLQIGARDVAFPYLNAVSLWLSVSGAGLVLISLVLGKFSAGGWTGYPPFTGIDRSPDTGVDYWIWALLISGVGTTLSGVNFLVTILRHRAPGMRLMHMPMFTWTTFATSIIILFAFPPLTVALALLEADRLFDALVGGEPDGDELDEVGGGPAQVASASFDAAGDVVPHDPSGDQGHHRRGEEPERHRRQGAGGGGGGHEQQGAEAADTLEADEAGRNAGIRAPTLEQDAVLRARRLHDARREEIIVVHQQERKGLLIFFLLFLFFYISIYFFVPYLSSF